MLQRLPSGELARNGEHGWSTGDTSPILFPVCQALAQYSSSCFHFFPRLCKDTTLCFPQSQVKSVRLLSQHE